MNLANFGIDFHSVELPHPEDMEREEFIKLYNKVNSLYMSISNLHLDYQSDLVLECECIFEQWLDNAQDYL